MNSVVVRPLEPPLTRTLGLVARKGRAEPPALRIEREVIMTLRSEEMDGLRVRGDRRARGPVLAN
jgi:hypothetical protein